LNKQIPISKSFQIKKFQYMCLQPVLLALSLSAVCGWVNAQKDSAEEPTVVAIHANYLHSLFRMSDGSLWGVGSNLTGALGGDGFVRPTPWIIINDVSAASAGTLHSLFLKKDGTVWAVGWVGSGSLGDGFIVDLEKKPARLYDQKKGEGILRVTPVRVMEQAAAVSAGWGHSLFLKNDGSVWASGENEDGRLGDGTTSDKPSPVRIMKKEVAAISAGFGHSLFLKKDGSAWATGRNDEGQLGDGTTTNRVSPVQVMTDVIAISASARHSLFLKKDGTVLATGENEDGRLGDGTKINRLKPVPILKNVTAISAGDVHSLFLRNDGSVWGTGDNRFGQLGEALWDLYPADRHVISPVQITAGVSSVSAGCSYSLFLMRDESVRASGHNMFNNLGFKGDSTPKPTKVEFRKRTAAEIEEWEDRKKELEKSPFAPPQTPQDRRPDKNP
jgi:alpha-tubulin suppressor-like RCC1 family protein